jgi:tripeptidyl-peptidase I
MVFLTTVSKVVVGLLLLCPQTFAAVTIESIGQAPRGWSVANTPSGSTPIVLQIALTMQNLDQLEPKLAAVSTPGNAAYGKYLDLDDINDLFGASEDSFNAVGSWLNSSGISDYKTQGSSIWFKTTVDNANSMLGTQFRTYKDSHGAQKIRTTQYSVPDSIRDHVDLIAPTTYFGKSRAERVRKTQAIKAIPQKKQIAKQGIPAICNQTLEYGGRRFLVFEPKCLNEVYNIHYTPDANSGSKIAFASFLNQSAGFSDLTIYEKHFGYAIQNFSVVLVNPDQGATDLPQPPSNAQDDEANLDVQNIMSLVQPLPVTELITAGSPPYYPDPAEPAGTPNENEPYLPYYEFLLSQSNDDLPQVISNSYGDEEQTVPYSYAVRVCNLIGLVGLRGVSVLESSGDEGVGASCVATNSSTPQFNPIFPVSNVILRYCAY